MAINPSDWGRRVEITVSGTIPSLTGYVAYISDSNLPSEIWTRALNGGGDLRVCLNSDGTNQLPLGIDTFDTTAQDAVLWTRFPSFATGSSVWLFYERAGETQPPVNDQFGRNAVWSDRISRFSLSQASNPLTDSSGNGGDLTASSSVLLNQSGIIGGAIRTTSSTDTQVDGTSSIQGLMPDSTISLWVRIEGVTGAGPTMVAQLGTSANGIGISYRNGPDTFSAVSSSTAELRSNFTLADNSNTWAKIDVTFSQSQVIIYANGAQDVTGAGMTSSPNHNGSISLARNSTSPILGFGTLNESSIDEAELCSFVKSGGYISTEHANQSNPLTFWTTGAPEDTSGGATYTITLDTGSYTYTGQAVALLSNKSISLDSDNYTYTGQSVDLLAGRSINLESDNYAYTGQDVTLVYNPSGGPTYSLPIDAGAYNYSGQDVQLIANRTLSIDGGIYTYTGSNLSLRANRSISIDSGAYVVTGNAVTLSANRAITLDVGNYAYTGSPVALSYSGEVISLISGYSVNYAQDAATATYTDDYIKARFI